MSEPTRKIFVWDGPTRLFHWLLALLILAAYLTEKLNWMQWHARVGYAVLALLLFRILWGLFGSDTARLGRLFAAPRAALRQLARSFLREPDLEPGHNPAGAWMVLFLLVLLLGETLSGLYIANDVAHEGPLTELVPAPLANTLTALHWILWDALLAAIALHLLAVFVYAAAKGQDLVRPMVTGWKNLPPNVPQPRTQGAARAALLFACAALATAALVAFL